MSKALVATKTIFVASFRDADDAVYDLHGKDLLGNRVTVEHAKEINQTKKLCFVVSFQFRDVYYLCRKLWSEGIKNANLGKDKRRKIT